MNRPQMVAPFAEEELRQFKGRGGKTMTFIEDETVMDRLDVGYGYGNWQVQVEPIGDLVVKVRLGVRESGEWTWYEDFGYANQPDGEVLKEAVSDGIRRCGRYVGIARDLYRKATYEPGGALGPPQGTETAADAPARPPAPDVETEELVGDLKPPRTGIVKNGGPSAYKLDALQGPDGHVIGFALETSKGNIPQCLVTGALGEALYLATSMNPARLVGEKVTLRGRLYKVRRPGRQSYHRLYVTGIQTNDWTLPADEAEPALPEPPPDIALVGETAPLFDDVA